MNSQEMLQGRCLLKDARLIDPDSGLDQRLDMVIADGKIVDIGESLQADVDRSIDLSGKILCPGLVDLRATFGEPGHEEIETIQSGLNAAAHGGFTAVCVQLDGETAMDCAADVRFQLERAGDHITKLLPLANVTRGGKGENLADLGELANAGAAAFSDGMAGLPTAKALRGCLSYAKHFNRPLFEIPREQSLLGGEVHEGNASLRSGLRGIPSFAEDLGVYRCLRCAEYEAAPIHLQLLSTARSVELLQLNQGPGQLVSADVSVAHLCFTEEDFLASDYNPAFRQDPPLRPESDQRALIQALRDGVLQAIVSDHRPADFDRIDREFSYCPAGTASLETCVAAAHKALVVPAHMSLIDLLAFFTTGPRRILGLETAGLRVGEAVDFTVLREGNWSFDSRKAKTRGVHSAWEGQNFHLRPAAIFRNNLFLNLESAQ